ncbi:unnamed protein product [Dicrocoelium dendriticum]|nr:unnamed protein product [Dicrocoelium dendriticum]
MCKRRKHFSMLLLLLLFCEESAITHPSPDKRNSSSHLSIMEYLTKHESHPIDLWPDTLLLGRPVFPHLDASPLPALHSPPPPPAHGSRPSRSPQCSFCLLSSAAPREAGTSRPLPPPSARVLLFLPHNRSSFPSPTSLPSYSTHLLHARPWALTYTPDLVASCRPCMSQRSISLTLHTPPGLTTSPLGSHRRHPARAPTYFYVCSPGPAIPHSLYVPLILPAAPHPPSRPTTPPYSSFSIYTAFNLLGHPTPPSVPARPGDISAICSLGGPQATPHMSSPLPHSLPAQASDDYSSSLPPVPPPSPATRLGTPYSPDIAPSPPPPMTGSPALSSRPIRVFLTRPCFFQPSRSGPLPPLPRGQAPAHSLTVPFPSGYGIQPRQVPAPYIVPKAVDSGRDVCANARAPPFDSTQPCPITANLEPLPASHALVGGKIFRYLFRRHSLRYLFSVASVPRPSDGPSAPGTCAERRYHPSTLMFRLATLLAGRAPDPRVPPEHAAAVVL